MSDVQSVKYFVIIDTKVNKCHTHVRPVSGDMSSCLVRSTSVSGAALS